MQRLQFVCKPGFSQTGLPPLLGGQDLYVGQEVRDALDLMQTAPDGIDPAGYPLEAPVAR